MYVHIICKVAQSLVKHNHRQFCHSTPKCFKGIGHFPGPLYKFQLKPDTKPTRHTPRKVPVHLQDSFRKEMDSLVEQGILEMVRANSWVNSCVIVEKDLKMDIGSAHLPNHAVNKKLRICPDPRDLKEALET